MSRRVRVRPTRSLRFLARRLLYSLVVLLGVLIVVFALVHLVPGDPVRIALGTRYTPRGLRRPARGERSGPADRSHSSSATSARRSPETSASASATATRSRRSCSSGCPPPCHSAIVGIVIALLIALPAGIWSALREGRVSDAIVRVTSQFGVSIPDFWMGILLIALFSIHAGLAADVGVPAAVRRPRRLVARTSSCPA